MRIKLFTLRYSSTLGGFDETPVAEFCRDKELLSFREHFFAVNDVPHLACVLAWQDATLGDVELRLARELRAQPQVDPSRLPISPPPERKRRRRDAPDPTAGLAEPERALFNTLREWRAKKAREEGVPPFLVFTNRHLIEMIARRPGVPGSPCEPELVTPVQTGEPPSLAGGNWARRRLTVRCQKRLPTKSEAGR